MQNATVYDQIGRSYRTTRAADPRIVAALVHHTGAPVGATICDVGAGSGNYANALAAHGYRVLAVEPSAVMRAQADPSDLVTWHEGVAERIPLPDGCADAAMCVLAVHHFRSLAATVRELDRVCGRGPFVFFTIDPRESAPLWFDDYFPAIVTGGLRIFPPLAALLAEVAAETGRGGQAHAFPLPRDLIDRFMQAAWHAPEAYFEETFRANNSGFATADPAHVEEGLARLRADLASGVWDHRYGSLRTRESFDAGYRFVVFRR
jgi:ubiquinone/menaquinone biosynthesis C-methylase UbiE